MSSNFDHLFPKLNSAQKIAVETIEGPLMVVAGPGTGKTQVLAMRVANILKKTHMRPRNILCITFSKSGALSMRQRLRDIIGPDAYGVTVDTIHGFCNSIISQNPIVFEQWSALKQISDVERYRELNKIIDQLLPDCVLVNKKSPYMRTRDIIGRISQLKREGVTKKEDLKRVVDEYEQIMATKSREGTKAQKKNLIMARKFREFIEVFHKYQEMLEATGRYDYEDMILRVVDALRQEDWMLAGLQEKYQYILVDEFQDTNGAQYQFIDILTMDPTGDNQPNLCIVGDDDQAIFRFQGANLTNILSFYSCYPKAKVITLETSYRCSQPILNAASSLISHNTERLIGRIEGLSKNLVSAVDTSKILQPKLILSSSDRTEPWVIADIVQEKIDKGIKRNEIAILVQTNAELQPIYDVLKTKNIPVRLSGKMDMLLHPLVLQTLCILRAVKNPEDSILFSSAIGCECFSCHPADIAQIRLISRENKELSLFKLLLNLDKENDNVSGDLRDSEKIINARDTILLLNTQLASRTLLGSLEHLLKETGLLTSSDGGSMDVLDFSALQEFFEYAKDRTKENPSLSFEEFLSDMDYFENAGYSDLRLSYDIPHLTQDGVQLMTAHKSKGLEFNTVILANFREGKWDKRRNPPSLSIPEDLLFGWEKDQKSYEKNQDERRVAYVAMTRAAQDLLFTCSKELTTGNSMKSVSPCSFFAEAGELEEFEQAIDDGIQSTLLSVPIRDFDDEMKSYLRNRIEHFAFSPTALNDFLEDPQLFLERHLLLVPQEKSDHLAYGNAVHHVLAIWANSGKEGNILSLEEMQNEISNHLKTQEHLTKKDVERLEFLGYESLKKYYKDCLQEPYPIVGHIEYSVRAHLEDIPLKGKIDRIDLLEQNSSNVRIVDYKTGKPKSSKQCEDLGYKRQLVFYALLLELGTPFSPKEYVLDFIGQEEDDPIQRAFEISSEDKEELKELIKKVWKKITNLDFTSID